MANARSIAAELTVSERALLFCLASRTEWKRVVTPSAVTRLIVHGLIERDATGRLRLTSEGRAALDALLGRDDDEEETLPD
jgi:hypothetical protein